jgi:regulator of PEP synthase PpsR (kinase-PPPase family)
MRRNHLDAVAAQLLIEWIAVVSAIADEVLWLGLDHVEVETGLNQTHRRIDALNYTMMHDDGQLADDLEEADVVLIGVSRTSKTPTSIYLANRGVNPRTSRWFRAFPCRPKWKRCKIRWSFRGGWPHAY